MSETLPPFLKWGSYKSHDQDKPNVLEMQVVDIEPFETAYTINVKVLLKEGKKWNETILPLKSLESKNEALLKAWNKNSQKDLIKVGKRFKLKTWLGKSTRSEYDIRRFVLEF
ncbi:MAG: hypothetical protein ACRDFB_02390 [Rhabdochlamydiaceae bacterium]